MSEQAACTGEGGVSWTSTETVDSYQRGTADRERFMAAATDLMFELADVKPGARLLDVAAGTGDQTLLAARRVGPTGSILAIDISTTMLDVAAQAVRDAGLTNVETRAMDAQAIDLESDSFDAVIVRLALMLIPDPVATLAGIRRVLRPGGRVSGLVFAAAERNPTMALPLDIVGRRSGQLSIAASRPGLFALGDAGDLEALFRGAGLLEVVVQTVPTPWRFPSVAAAVRQASGIPVIQQAMAGLDERLRAEVLAEIEQSFRQFDGPDGYEAPGEMLVAAGMK